MVILLLNLLALLLPTQLGFHFWPSWSYLQGLRLDYLSPTLYLTDILLLLLLVANLAKLITSIKNNLNLTLLFSLAVTVNILFSLLPYHTIIFWLRIILLFNLTSVFKSVTKAKLKPFFTLLSLSTITISLLAIFQFLKGGSLDGVFYFLGERHFNLTTPDIAKITLNQTFLRPYSTFSHPNSLAGYLVTMIFLFLAIKRSLSSQKILIPTLTLSFIALLLTFSRSAIITLLILLPLLHPKISRSWYRYFPLILIPGITLLSLILFNSTVISSDPSISHRLFLAVSSLSIILTHPFTGTGLGSFIPALSKLKPFLDFRLLQPVHNIYLLTLSELGLLIIPLVFILKRSKLKFSLSLPLLAILLTGTLDHYWLTLPQNLLLLFIVLGLHHHLPDTIRP